MGGYNSLPQLRTAQIDDPLTALAKMGQVRAMQQQQAMMPGQLQEQQQRIAAGQQEATARQRAMDEQSTLMQTMAENPGATLGQLIPMLAKSGKVTPQTLFALQQKDTEIRKNAAELDDKTLAVKAAAHGQLQNLYNNAMQMDDQTLAQNWPAIVQQVKTLPGMDKSADMFDPAKPMTREQLQQYGPVLGLQDAYLKNEAAKRAETAKAAGAEAELPGKVAESEIKTSQAAFAKKYNLPAGVPVDMMEMTDYLDKNPGKGPKDYAAWKASIAPSVRFNLETQAGAGAGAPQTPDGKTDWAAVAKRLGMSPQALDQSSERYFQTGTLPPLGRGTSGPALQRAIMNRTAELHPEGQLAANSAEFKANAESLKKLQTNFDQVSAFESTAMKNIDLLQKTAAQIPDLGSRFANIPVRMINERMIGTDQMAAFKTALNTAQTESAKVLNSSSASGILSDSARHELQDIVDGNMPYSAMVASLNTLKQDMANRHQSYAEQISDIKGRMGGGATQGAPQTKGVTQKTQPIYATNPQTKQRIVSNDGGQTWQPAQ